MVWFPEDENTLPTPLEHTFATEAIDTLRQEMEQTLITADQLEQELQKTRAKAEQIKHEIFKRVIWLAPIRRIPADILSLLFIQASQDDWKAPLVLGAVCRRWRNILIDTPRAWAFIQITPSCRLLRHELLDLWLSRCGALKIHVSLRPRASAQFVEAISQHKRNLQSLSFFGNAKQLRGQYTQLEELRLGPEPPLSFLWYHTASGPKNEGELQADGKEDMSLHPFPKLVSLHLHGPSLGMMEAIAHKPLFPSLQKLHIYTSGPHWLRIIQCCADFLTTLTIETNPKVVDTVPKDELDMPIIFPQLQDLHLVCIVTTSHWPSFQTPHLKSYHEYNGQDVSPMHVDVSTVASLLLHNPEGVEWSYFTSVTHLRIRDTAHAILHEMTILTNNASLCPKIHSVECVAVGPDATDESLIASYMAARSGRTGTAINFRYTEVEYDPREDNPPCFTFCHSHSRPEQPYWDPYDEGLNVLDEEEESDEHDDYEYDDYGGYDYEDHSDDWDYDRHEYLRSLWY